MQVIRDNIVELDISVVIPTCNRKDRLLSLLPDLDQSYYPTAEVIIVDSSDGENLVPSDYEVFKNLNILYIRSKKSVCLQRNIGIKKARSPWVFLCDDDIEVPPDYLQKLISHINEHPKVGAASGLVLEKHNNEWTDKHPVTSASELAWKFIFQLSLWGDIACKNNNYLIKKIKSYYQKKGNHISKAGWPVITDFTGDYFVSPVYGLGASLIRKDWLLHSPYDEGLDQHGMGDNYGVALGFPTIGIHILNNAQVYHHQESTNRLQKPLQYLRRVLALDYFINTGRKLGHVKKSWFLWSLIGNLLAFILAKNLMMALSAFKSIWIISLNGSSSLKGSSVREKVTQPHDQGKQIQA